MTSVISRAAVLAAVAALPFAFLADAGRALTIDLADIVGGGDGSGNGANAGVDVTDGSTTTTQTGPISAAANTFVAADNPLVDGVVIPDGGPGGTASVPISSTGLTVSGISDSTEAISHTWDHVWNGTNFGTTTTWVGDVLGMHASKGITFDLEAIGAAHGGLAPYSFFAIPITGTSPSAQVDYYVFVDGVLVDEGNSRSISGEDDFAQSYDFVLPFNARFLTLITSSDGENSGDWSSFLDPVLELVTPLTLGQIDTFDSNLEGWSRGDHIVEGGDGFLRIPGTGQGVYLNTYFHGAPWAGDYVEEGVVSLRVELRAVGTDDLTVYAAFGTERAPSDGGDWFATEIPVSLTAGAGWGTYDIPIGPDQLVSVQGSGTYASVMENVQTIRFLHNDHPDARALTVVLDSVLDIDDVQALPEPTGLPTLGAGAALLATLARHRRGPARRTALSPAASRRSA